MKPLELPERRERIRGPDELTLAEREQIEDVAVFGDLAKQSRLLAATPSAKRRSMMSAWMRATSDSTVEVTWAVAVAVMRVPMRRGWASLPTPRFYRNLYGNRAALCRSARRKPAFRT